MSLASFVSSIPGSHTVVANGLRLAANVNSALGSKSGVGNLRAEADNIQNPAVNYHGVANPTSTSLPKPSGGTIPGQVLGDNTPAPGGSSSSDSATSAYYGNVVDQLKNLLGVLPTQQSQGEANINNNANLSLNRANESESNTLSTLQTQREQADRNKAASINNIDQNVANTVDSFKRILAGGHAGNSAFANDFVPTATARQGSTQRAGVFNSYGQDVSGIDTAKKQAEEQYGNNVQDINAKRNNDLLTFINGINGQRDSINQQAAQAAYYKEAAGGGNGASTEAAIAPFNASTQDKIAALNALFAQYANPTYTVNPVSVTTPNLQSYSQDPLVARLSADNPTLSLADLPYLPQIKKQPSLAVAGA